MGSGAIESPNGDGETRVIEMTWLIEAGEEDDEK